MSTAKVEYAEFTHNLLNTIPIVESILKNLNARDLNCCARVCPFWANVVSKLKSKRKTRAWTCLQAKTESRSRNKYVALFEGTRDFIQGLYTEPDIVFMTCQTDLLNHRLAAGVGTPESRNQSRTRLTYKEYVRSLLPTNCRLVCVGSGGIVGTDSDLQKIHEVENAKGVALLCLPKYAGFHVEISDDIEGSEDRMASESSDDSEGDVGQNFGGKSISEDAKQFVQTLISEGRPTCKAVLMFIADFQVPRSVGFDTIKNLSGALLAGAYIDEIVAKAQEKYPLIQLAAISGENVHVASVIINENINSPAAAEECIKRLKEFNLPEENSFAFMFACLGRGEGLYQEPDVESSLFKKYFPRTPLIGLFGNGEIGFEHCSKEQVPNDAPVRKRPKSSPKLYHAYTTILVLFSIT